MAKKISGEKARRELVVCKKIVSPVLLFLLLLLRFFFLPMKSWSESDSRSAKPQRMPTRAIKAEECCPGNKIVVC